MQNTKKTSINNLITIAPHLSILERTWKRFQQSLSEGILPALAEQRVQVHIVSPMKQRWQQQKDQLQMNRAQKLNYPQCQ